MKFTKMHGLGNDYVYVNCFKEQVTNPSETAIRVSDRHFGIGSDGLILIKPSDKADFQMEMYNADGSLGAMCGNGIRCVAKYVYDYGLTDKTQISVETKSGIKYLDLTVEDGKVTLVRVDMGAPILVPEQIPVRIEGYGNGKSQSDHFFETLMSQDNSDSGTDADAEDEYLANEPIVGERVLIGTDIFSITCVSMGNPHCIVPVQDVDGLEIEKIGPRFENHPMFPDRVNTEFVRVLDHDTVQMRVWERGSGETLACGTGACAVAVASALNGWTGNKVTVKLRGGDLQIEWDRGKNTVFMTGPAATVFEGEIN
ncbi:MAG: diaminopimelate epimerase [Lachnospiraceae bacterium]|nr:diaminopimelate epimerase [Lachnospiraceae bacterium]